MIDLVHAQKVFKEYLKSYDEESGDIKLKIVHTYGVMEKSEYIGKKLNLNEGQIELAKLIALLHDIGRFEQRKSLKEFEDFKGLDHAEYGLQVLFKDGWIRKFIEDDKYDDIICKAIENHNKYQIQEGLTKEELLQAKIIRDADKLDNFRVKDTEKFENMFHYNPETIEYETISPIVYKTFMGCKQIDVKERKTQVDIWISYLAFIFDINFDASLQYIVENNYINRLIDRVEYKNEDTKIKMEEIRNCANVYVKERLKLDERKEY